MSVLQSRPGTVLYDELLVFRALTWSISMENQRIIIFLILRV